MTPDDAAAHFRQVAQRAASTPAPGTAEVRASAEAIAADVRRAAAAAGLRATVTTGDAAGKTALRVTVPRGRAPQAAALLASAVVVRRAALEADVRAAAERAAAAMVGR